LAPTLKFIIFMIISIFTLVLISKFSKVIFSFFLLYINISNILIGHIALHWGYEDANILPRLYTMMVSPNYEKIEYLKNYIDYRDFLLVLYIAFVLYLVFKYIRHCQHSFKSMAKISLIVTTVLVLLLSFIPNHIEDLFKDIPYRYNKEPFNIPLKCIDLFNDPTLEAVEKRNKYLRNQKFTVDKNMTTLYDKVVVVIGESANKHHMGLYGYDKKTTPFLSSMKNKIFIFNAIAPVNQTRYSVPILLTEANVHDFTNQYIYSPSIVKTFYKRGYKTNWISNQGIAGKHDGTVSSLALEADKQVFINKGDFFTAETDDKILNYLDELKENSKKELNVFHLIGSHLAYERRYTKEHLFYNDPKTSIEKYDNTIFFTDYILENIYKHFSNNKKLLLIYVSDHGEVIDSHTTHLCGHSFNPAHKDEYDIPFIIYSSIENPRLSRLYKQNKKHYFNMENLNYMIEYISGFREDANVSLSSKVFVVDPKNIVDYKDLKYYESSQE